MTVDESAALRDAARGGAVVLVYHSAGAAPANAAGLHHVSAATVRAHLEAAARYFDFVTVDALAEMTDPRGKAALTFDDGFRNALEETLETVAPLRIPMTCYVNPAVLDGAVLWREKVRCIEARGWTAELENGLRGFKNPERKGFYRYSKHPDNDSRMVDAALENFLHKRGARIDGDDLVRDDKQLPRHPLVNYGNHSQRHYVLASLPAAVQRAEIAEGAKRLGRIGLPEARLSRVFSMPFGAAMDYNRATVGALRQLGYRAALLSRQRLHRRGAGGEGEGEGGVTFIERIMPRTETIAEAVTLADKNRQQKNHD